jgi:hypothetical protein
VFISGKPKSILKYVDAIMPCICIFLPDLNVDGPMLLQIDLEDQEWVANDHCRKNILLYIPVGVTYDHMNLP